MKVDWTTTQLACVCALSFLIQGYASAYSGGEGTSVSPYVLRCKEDVMELASRPDDYDKSFVVIEDIDLESVLFEGPIVAPNVVFVPAFGEYDGLFTGGFNGNGIFSIASAGDTSRVSPERSAGCSELLQKAISGVATRLAQQSAAMLAGWSACPLRAGGALRLAWCRAASGIPISAAYSRVVPGWD